jgi:hypothetical protein
VVSFTDDEHRFPDLSDHPPSSFRAVWSSLHSHAPSILQPPCEVLRNLARCLRTHSDRVVLYPIRGTHALIRHTGNLPPDVSCLDQSIHTIPFTQLGTQQQLTTTTAAATMAMITARPLYLSLLFDLTKPSYHRKSPIHQTRPTSREPPAQSQHHDGPLPHLTPIVPPNAARPIDRPSPAPLSSHQIHLTS